MCYLPPLLPNLSQDPDAGLGVAATRNLRRRMRHRWLGRRLGALLLPSERTLVAVQLPLGLVISAATVTADPELGGSYQELLDLGLLDERGVVMLFLLVEKMRGRGSRYAPWLDLLPDRWGCCVCWGEACIGQGHLGGVPARDGLCLEVGTKGAEKQA